MQFETLEQSVWHQIVRDLHSILPSVKYELNYTHVKNNSTHSSLNPQEQHIRLAIPKIQQYTETTE